MLESTLEKSLTALLKIFKMKHPLQKPLYNIRCVYQGTTRITSLKGGYVRFFYSRTS